MLNITQQDALWLVETYNRFRNYGQVNKYIDMHLKAQTLIKGVEAQKPSCTCAFPATARIASSLYEQHENEIKTIAYPPQIQVIDDTTTDKKSSRRGRKRSEGNTGEE